METEGEIAVGLRSDGVVYELHREASILRRATALGCKSKRCQIDQVATIHCGIPRVPLGYRKIIIELLQILKTIERSGEQRVGADAWRLLSLPAVHPMVTMPTMFPHIAARKAHERP